MPRNPALQAYVRNRGFIGLVNNDRVAPGFLTLNDRTAFLTTLAGGSAGAFGTTTNLDVITYFTLDHPTLGLLDEVYNPLF